MITQDARRLALVRHCATAANEAGQLLSRANPGLSDLGRSQCASLKHRWSESFAGWHLLTSPSLRAVETARFLFDIDPITEHPGLEERDVGPYEGMTADELRLERARVGAGSQDMTLVWEGVENVEQDASIVRRVSSAISESLTAESIPEDAGVVLVTHAGVVKALLHALLGIPAERPYGFRVGLGSVAVLHRHRSYWELQDFWQNPESRPRFLD